MDTEDKIIKAIFDLRGLRHGIRQRATGEIVGIEAHHLEHEMITPAIDLLNQLLGERRFLQIKAVRKIDLKEGK